VLWRSACELSRLRLKRPVRLVRPDAQDTIFFFPDVPRRCWQKADWEKFDNKIKSAGMDFSHLQGTNDTLRAISNVTKLIHGAADEAVPLKRSRQMEVPWRNHSLTLAKQSVKRADRRACLEPSDTNREDS